MDCTETQTLLTAFHDGELRDVDRARVELHLRGCPECGRLLADLARADEAAGVPDPGPAYWDRFNARLADRIEREEEGPKAAVLRPKQGWVRQQLRYLVPAAAAAALVVVVVRYGGHAPVAPKSTPPAAESVLEPTAPDPAGGRTAKREIEPPAAEKIGAEGSRRVAAVPNRGAEVPAAPPPVTAEDRIPAAAREEQDSLADRYRPEEKEQASRVPTAAPPGVEAPSPPVLSAYKSETAPSPPAAAADERLPKAQAEQEKREEAASPAMEPMPAAEGKSTYGMKSGADSHAAKASSATSVGKARAKAGPSPRSMDAARAPSPCKTARELASRGRMKDAEAAQRECLAKDPSPHAQEKGLIFLAELLDRQARFAEADEVLTEVHRQFPESLPLDLYRQQRPMVQKQQVPVPAVR